MKHSSTRELFDYWNERRGARPVPERAEIEPGAIRRILADTFILSVDAARGHPFRLAGTRVCAAFGRELKGLPFTGLWAPSSQPLVREMLDIVSSETVGVVAGVRTTSADDVALDLELLLLPLNHRGRTERILGAIAPMTVPYWLGTVALQPLTLATHRYLGEATRRVVAPATAPSAAPQQRIRAGLVVYDGGQQIRTWRKPTAAD
jgi:hypothetical protein